MVQRWGVEDLLQLSSDVVKYAVIKERLMEPLRKKWENVKYGKIKILHYKHQRWMLASI